MSITNNQLENTTIIATLEELQSPLYDWTIMLGSVIFILGVFLNLICIIIFLNPKLKDSTYRFMLANSVAEFCYTIICAFDIYLYCGRACEKNMATFEAQIYYIWFSEYFSSCMAVYCILIEIYISTKRYLLIVNKRILERFSNGLVIFVLGIISILYYVPILFIYKIESYEESENNQTKTFYTTVSNEFGQTDAGRIIPTILSTVRAILVVVVLLIINIISSIAFKRHMKKKAMLSGSSRGSRVSRSRVDSSK